MLDERRWTEIKASLPESPQIRLADAEVISSIDWRGVCDLVLDPETLSKVEQRGDCSGPPPA